MSNPEKWFEGGDVRLDVVDLDGKKNASTSSSSTSTSSSSNAGQKAVDVLSGFIDSGNNDIQTAIVKNITGKIIQKTSDNAVSFWTLYANLDRIRPYFDVDSKDVFKRLLYSLIPRTSTELTTKSTDLYGPVMLIFTLVAILLLGMKMSHRVIQEGTLLGTSFAVCFSYWALTSLFFYFLGYLFSVAITPSGYLSLVGYGLFGHCISLLVHCFLSGTWIDNVVVLLIGGFSALSIGVSFFTNTPNSKNGAIIGLFASGIQFFFLLYLKMYYATFYGVVARVFND